MRGVGVLVRLAGPLGAVLLHKLKARIKKNSRPPRDQGEKDRGRETRDSSGEDTTDNSLYVKSPDQARNKWVLFAGETQSRSDAEVIDKGARRFL